MILYSKDHVWVNTGNMVNPETVTAGITEYAVKELKEIVLVDLGNSQRVVKRGDELGSIESVKTVSSVVCPFDCSVEAVNPDPEKDPAAMNAVSRDAGLWLYNLRPTNMDWKDGLMDREAYTKYLKEELGYEAEEDQAD